MTGIIVLCRYNSSRLPGKILKKIHNKEILKYIVERLSLLKGKYPIVICTSNNSTDDPIVDFCIKNGLNYYRGELNNVAKRFLDCAIENKMNNAIRINGDNLFLDPKIIEQMVVEMKMTNAKFISNVDQRTFPKGISVEIVNTNYYKENYKYFSESDLEHVMTYFYRIKDNSHYYFYNQDSSIDYGAINLAIDTKEDFDNANKILNLMDEDHIMFGYKEIVEFFKKID